MGTTIGSSVEDIVDRIFDKEPVQTMLNYYQGEMYFQIVTVLGDGKNRPGVEFTLNESRKWSFPGARLGKEERDKLAALIKAAARDRQIVDADAYVVGNKMDIYGSLNKETHGQDFVIVCLFIEGDPKGPGVFDPYVHKEGSYTRGFGDFLSKTHEYRDLAPIAVFALDLARIHNFWV